MQCINEHNASVACSALEAIQKIELEAPDRFDVIISAYNMPEMDRVGFLEIVKTLSPNAKRVLMTCEERSRFIIPIEEETFRRL